MTPGFHNHHPRFEDPDYWIEPGSYLDRIGLVQVVMKCGIHALETEPIESIWDGCLFDLPTRSTQPTKKEKSYA